MSKQNDLGGVAGTVLNANLFHNNARGRRQNCRNLNGQTRGNIINHSREPVRRNEFIIAAYDSDIDQVKQLLTTIIESDDRILKDREMTVR